MRVTTLVSSFGLIAASCFGAIPTPEESPLFERHVDPWSRVTSYILKPGLAGECQQTLYFTQKSMTDDGRFLVFQSRANEFRNRDGSPRVNVGPRPGASRNDKVIVLDLVTGKWMDVTGARPAHLFLDVREDVLYYLDYKGNAPEKGFVVKRDLLKDPMRAVKLCPLPDFSQYGRLKTYCSHLTLTKDRAHAFLDVAVGDTFIQGLLNLETGMFDRWGQVGFYLNHGQVNPEREDVALAAYEGAAVWYDSKGNPHDMDFENGVWPRLQLLGPGWRKVVKAEATNYAGHECWDEDGKGFYWCARSVYHHDLATGQQILLAPKGAHASVSRGLKYVAADQHVGIDTSYWWRGSAWQVYFYNRISGQGIDIVTFRPPLCPNLGSGKISTQHPDPHPCFVANDRYVLFTYTSAGGYMDVALTPVTQLVARTSRDLKAFSRALPAAERPERVMRDFSIPSALDLPLTASCFDALQMAMMQAQQQGNVEKFQSLSDTCLALIKRVREQQLSLEDKLAFGVLQFAAFEADRTNWQSYDAGVHVLLEMKTVPPQTVEERLRLVSLQLAGARCIGDDSFQDEAIKFAQTLVANKDSVDNHCATLAAVLHQMPTFVYEYHDLMSAYQAWATSVKSDLDLLMESGTLTDQDWQRLHWWTEALLTGLRDDWLDATDFVPILKCAYMKLVHHDHGGDLGQLGQLARCAWVAVRPVKVDEDFPSLTRRRAKTSLASEERWSVENVTNVYRAKFSVRSRQRWHTRPGGKGYVTIQDLGRPSVVRFNGSNYDVSQLSVSNACLDVTDNVKYGKNFLEIHYPGTNAMALLKAQLSTYPPNHYRLGTLQIKPIVVGTELAQVTVSYEPYVGSGTNYTFTVRDPIFREQDPNYQYYLRIGEDPDLVPFTIQNKEVK